jgi:pseudaminic acid cytidylyltransferase
MHVAVIPARGGSKRIPNKNVRMFCGKPMIAWTIEIALLSGLFDRVIVSTESEHIARTAASLGAEVPFSRPAELADDYAGTAEVVAHAVRWLESEDLTLDAVCCLYATAPFLRAEDLAEGLRILQSSDWSFCFSATDYGSPIFRAFQRSPDGSLAMFFPEHYAARSQDLPVALHDAGQFYWGRPVAWSEARPVFGDKSTTVMIPRWRVQDIDTEDDWHRAELLWHALQLHPDAVASQTSGAAIRN